MDREGGSWEGPCRAISDRTSRFLWEPGLRTEYFGGKKKKEQLFTYLSNFGRRKEAVFQKSFHMENVNQMFTKHTSWKE